MRSDHRTQPFAWQLRKVRVSGPYSPPTGFTHLIAPLLAGPVVSDNGNFIIDAPFERQYMEQPYTVSA